MKRTLIVFVVCCICMSLAVPYASATTFGTMSNDGFWFDLMPYINKSYITFSNPGEIKVNFDPAPITNYNNVDILFYTDSTDFAVGSSTSYLSVYEIGFQLYRAVGNLKNPTSSKTAYFYFEPKDGSFLSVISCSVSLQAFSYYDIGYSYSLVNRSYSGTFDHAVGAGSVSTDLSMGISDPINYSRSSFYIKINPYMDDIRKYDFLNFNLSLTCANIYSIRCIQHNVSIDFSTNFINPDGGTDNHTRYLQIFVDLSKIDRLSSYPLSVYIDGDFSEGDSSTVYFNPAIAYLSVNDNSMQSWLSALFVNLRSWFSTQFTKLDQVISELKILNGRDSEAVSAQQTQEEINVSINNQLVGAVEDWNTNIEVVETGYDMAFSKTTPALTWLASLADGIFNGMGWFGNVYFLVGLISVIMLVLSKSGLAHKIGSISRRKGD